MWWTHTGREEGPEEVLGRSWPPGTDAQLSKDPHSDSGPRRLDRCGETGPTDQYRSAMWLPNAEAYGDRFGEPSVVD